MLLFDSFGQKTKQAETHFRFDRSVQWKHIHCHSSWNLEEWRSSHSSATWTGNHRNALVIFRDNPRISPALHAHTGVTRSYLIYALLCNAYTSQISTSLTTPHFPVGMRRRRRRRKRRRRRRRKRRNRQGTEKEGGKGGRIITYQQLLHVVAFRISFFTSPSRKTRRTVVSTR